MTKRHNADKSTEEDMSKRASTKSRSDAASRKVSNDKLNSSLKGMYDDVVSEPVPDEMNNFDGSVGEPEG